VLALVWLLAPQYPVALLPYGIYSVFHVATYTRSNVIPTIQPNRAPAGAAGAAGVKPQGNPIADSIGSFVKSYYDTSMSVVSNLEIFIWFRIFVSAVLFQSRSWALLGLYTAFLRARFSQSSHVQGSFNTLELRIDSIVSAQGTPPAAQTVWEGIKGVTRQFYTLTDLSKYANGSSVPKKTS
jgi:transmembrane protein 33